MDNQKLILFLAFSFVLLLLWEAWQEDYGRQGSPGDKWPQTPGEVIYPGAGQEAGTSAPDIPTLDIPPSSTAATTTQQSPAGVLGAVLKSGQRIHVLTDLFDAEIDSVGGDLRRVNLLAYPVALNRPDELYKLLFDGPPPDIFVAQSGLLSKQATVPDHHAEYTLERTEYRLQEGEDELKVPLYWQGPDGLQVVKTFTFRRDSYVIDIDFEIINNLKTDWSGRFYHQLQRTDASESNSTGFIYTYMGGVASSQSNKYEKIDFSEMDEWKPEESYTKGGWVAMSQHYFFAAVIPRQDQFNYFYTNVVEGTKFIIGTTTQERVVESGASGHFSTQLFVGPKVQDRMKRAAENLELTVDYGVLTVLSQPLFWLLNYIHGVVGNWGWSIILVTLVIKLVFYKLSEASYRSMAKMKTYQPKMASLRERYGDDKQRMSQAMMELYKKEKINPLGGCLPILVQIPVFIALYWVLLETVELRQAPFIFWIKDMSTKDPYYVLPLIMGATMFLQQKLHPPTVDPIQQKIFMALPFVFTVFFAFFPSGLVLYWVANNSLSILQQWHITRKIAKTTQAKA